MQEPPGVDESPPSARTSPRSRLAAVVLGVVLVVVVAGAYWVKTRPASETASRAGTVAGSEAAAMKAGLDSLYSRNDPEGAAAQFRRVLALNPGHYGATFQLATALDRAGKPGEAQPYWEKMLPMAEASNDAATVATVRARLRQAPPASEEAVQGALMRAGLDALYGKGDPNAAAVGFRKVLERNPSHYGATYQLAAALDRAGKPAEARPLWEKVLKMAEASKDPPTLAAARARLAQKP